MGVYVVDEFESLIKIEVAPFFVALDPISARNLGRTPERWIVRVRECLHCVSRRILNKGREF